MEPTKRVKTTVVNYWRVQQEEDSRQLTKIQQRLAREFGELERTGPRDPVAFADKQRELRVAAERPASELLGAMAKRFADAKAAVREWHPGTRRLTAALAHPLEAVALRDRLERATLAALEKVAQQAVEQSNDLLSDAVLQALEHHLAQISDMGVRQSLRARFHAMLDNADIDGVRAVVTDARAICSAVISAEILYADIAGRPLSPTERLTKIRRLEAELPISPAVRESISENNKGGVEEAIAQLRAEGRIAAATESELSPSERLSVERQRRDTRRHRSASDAELTPEQRLTQARTMEQAGAA